MSASTPLEALIESAAVLLEGRGFRRLSPATTQPADAYLDLIGEEARRRLVTFVDARGQTHCLRSDMTVPAARRRLAEGADAIGGDGPERLWCHGEVYRLPRSEGAVLEGGVAAFHHIDIEILAEPDAVAADCEAVGLACEIVRSAGAEALSIRVGDIALFADFVAALHLPEALASHVVRCFRHRHRLDGLTAEALARRRRNAVGGADSMSVAFPAVLAQMPMIGARSVADIRERFARSRLNEPPIGLSPDQTALIREFLDLVAPLPEAGEKLARLYARAGAKPGPAWRDFERRAAILSSPGGVGDMDMTFAAGFGREMAYYSGFVFEIAPPGGGEAQRLAGGGRYDRMMSDLGAPCPIPAVGCALWCERLLAAGDDRGANGGAEARRS